MDTLTPGRTTHHESLRLATHAPIAFVDLTERLTRLVTLARIAHGTLHVQTTHTTTAIVVNEHEPLLLVDFERFLDRLAPRGSYWHDEVALRDGVPADEPRNGHAHCRALLLPTSVTLNIIDGNLALGRWQRVLMVELDGPRERTVSALALGEVAL